MNIRSIRFCCGSKNCPTLKVDVDTKVFTLLDNNQEVEFTLEQARLIKQVLDDLVTELS